MINRHIIQKLRQINLFKTLLFNFRTLPFYQAIKLPVIIFGKCIIVDTHRGGVKISTPIRRGMLQIGRLPDHRIFGNQSISPCVINIKGVLVLNGDHVFLGPGSMIAIEQHAEMFFGDDVQMGHNTILFASEKIVFGNQISVSWNTQFYDTDFHYSITDECKVRNNKKTVHVGDSVWVGNHVTIQKGSIPSNSIVSSYSLINKDFSNGRSGLYAGIPAVHIKDGIRRLFDFTEEHRLDQFFWDNKDVKEYYMMKI